MSIVTELQDGHSKIHILAGLTDFSLQDAQIACVAYTVLCSVGMGEGVPFSWGWSGWGLQTDHLTTLLHAVKPLGHV